MTVGHRMRSALQRFRRGPLLLALLSVAPLISAQDKNVTKDDDDLDVTMQVLDDPQPRQPNEALRIPLPKPTPPSGKRGDKPGDKNKAKDADPKKNDPDPNKSEGRGDANDKRPDKERGRDAPDGPKERAKEAHEQRKEARREEDRRERDGPPGRPPKDPPGRPPR